MRPASCIDPSADHTRMSVCECPCESSGDQCRCARSAPARLLCPRSKLSRLETRAFFVIAVFVVAQTFEIVVAFVVST
jgi:hypothetical protein